ncbi:helix-turn-helix domain-containing protein [Solibacillus sp. FSL W7-1436]|uniref:helix-turn-helix transcriptional regulator n=1 Tax=Solibacillus sp. FSL W7-1436 TaxID=2921705 RepID=UPI0030FA187A
MVDCNELRRLRKYHELTLEDMGKMIGVDARTYSNKEKGISQFKLNEMVAISCHFKKSIEEIFLNKKFM